MLVDTIKEKDKKIEELMTSNKESNKMKNYNEELKKLQITKDLEINKLNEQIQSKDKEIERLKKTIDDKVPVDYKEKEKELNAQFDIERNKYEQKINDLELKIYKVNDDNKSIKKDMKKLLKFIRKEVQNLKKKSKSQSSLLCHPKKKKNQKKKKNKLIQLMTMYHSLQIISKIIQDAFQRKNTKNLKKNIAPLINNIKNINYFLQNNYQTKMNK